MIVKGVPKGKIWVNPQFYRSRKLRRLLKAIHYHPGRSLKEQAEVLGLSASRIYHLIAVNGKGGPKGREWKIDERMDFAAKGILAGFLPNKLFKACGYSTLQGFCRAFRNYWRKSCRKYKKWALTVKNKDPLIPPHWTTPEFPPGADYYKGEGVEMFRNIPESLIQELETSQISLSEQLVKLRSMVALKERQMRLL